MLNNTNSFTDNLNQGRTGMEKYLNLGKVRWEKLITTIRSQEEVQNPGFADEQIWTFLMACGYALSGEAGLHDQDWQPARVFSSTKLRQDLVGHRPGTIDLITISIPFLEHCGELGTCGR